METFEYTNKGSRDENQDYIIHKVFDDESAVFVVADGMGGYSYGKEASRIVGDSILEFIEMHKEHYPSGELLCKSLQYANDNIMLKRFGVKKKMGSVVAVLYILREVSYMSWIGDSRIYIYRNNEEIFRTEDHSIINELKKIKNLRAMDIEQYSSIVTKALMGDENIKDIPTVTMPIKENDVLILCSDGFYRQNAVSDYMGLTDSEIKDKLDSISNKMDDNYSLIKIKI